MPMIMKGKEIPRTPFTYGELASVVKSFSPFPLKRGILFCGVVVTKWLKQLLLIPLRPSFEKCTSVGKGKERSSATLQHQYVLRLCNQTVSLRREICVLVSCHFLQEADQSGQQGFKTKRLQYTLYTLSSYHIFYSQSRLIWLRCIGIDSHQGQACEEKQSRSHECGHLFSLYSFQRFRLITAVSAWNYGNETEISEKKIGEKVENNESSSSSSYISNQKQTLSLSACR